ncbi:MAG TPA: cytochrome c [Thermoleophilaceae bacterium]|nr:cytochrome c [Thermoleophilaceae bacterium]
MEVVLFLAPFVLLGAGIIFVAFSGGPGRAREAYLTKGGGFFKFSMALLYVALGLAVPALVIANREPSEGATAPLKHETASDDLEEGKELFRITCASCHTLAAANAHGVTGPNLDEVGEMTEERVLTAIRVGGTGQKRMPAALLEGEDAELVAKYVSAVAGKK